MADNLSTSGDRDLVILTLKLLNKFIPQGEKKVVKE